MARVVVGDDQGDLFGGSKSGEESQLIIVAMRFAPVVMEGGDEGLGVLNTERVDRWSILLAETRAPERRGRIAPLRIVEVAEVEGASQGADRVVVSLLVAGIRVCDLYQHRIR